jgi:hypothetical protein
MSKDDIINKAIALESIKREVEGRQMAPAEMLAWKQVLLTAPDALFAELIGDGDRLRSYMQKSDDPVVRVALKIMKQSEAGAGDTGRTNGVGNASGKAASKRWWQFWK